MACLQKMMEHCEFGVSLTDTLQDRLVTGMRNETIQRCLLWEANLIFARAVEIAETAEKAEKDAAELHPIVKIPEVHQVPAVSRHPANVYCHRCGSHNLGPQVWCRFCQKMGHIEQVCKNKEREREKGRKKEDSK